MKTFDSLSEQEILTLAISLEEEDERVYADFAEGCARISLPLQQFLMPCVPMKHVIARGFFPYIKSNSGIMFLSSGDKM